jgi:hypothetical protein
MSEATEPATKVFPRLWHTRRITLKWLPEFNAILLAAGACENFLAAKKVLRCEKTFARIHPNFFSRHVCVVHIRTASHCTQVASCPPVRDCHKHPRSQLRQSCPRKHLCQCAKKLGRADSLVCAKTCEIDLADDSRSVASGTHAVDQMHQRYGSH